MNKKTKFTYMLIGLCISLGFAQASFAQSYWRKAIQCTSAEAGEAGEAYIDIDQANLRSVQLVIKNPAAIQYLRTRSNTSFHVVDANTAVVQGETNRPNFSPSDFQQFESNGSFGSGYGWYLGHRVYLRNGVLSIDFFENAYNECVGYWDEGICRGEILEHPETVVKNWNFPNCTVN